jgi:hypothetical protein
MLKLDHFTGVMGIPSGSGKERERENAQRETTNKSRQKKKSKSAFLCVRCVAQHCRKPKSV